jgi:hypothetical protein
MVLEPVDFQKTHPDLMMMARAIEGLRRPLLHRVYFSQSTGFDYPLTHDSFSQSYRGQGYGYPEGPGSRTQRDDYIEPGVGLAPGRGGARQRVERDDYIEPGRHGAERDDYFEPGVSPGRYGAGRGGPPAGQRDDYLEPGVGAGRYGAGRGGMSSGPGGDRDDYIEPGVGSERYGARNEEYHERPHDESYGGRGGGESGSGRRGGYGRGQSAYGEDDYDRSGQGYGRGEPGHGRGGEAGYGRDESYGRGRGRGYGDESEFAPGHGRGGYGRGRGGYGEGGYDEEGYGRGRGRGGGKAGYEEDAYGEEAYGSGRPPPQGLSSFLSLLFFHNSSLTLNLQPTHMPTSQLSHPRTTNTPIQSYSTKPRRNFIIVSNSRPSTINIQVEVLEQEANTRPPNLISRITHRRMGTYARFFAKSMCITSNYSRFETRSDDHSSPMDTDAIGSAAAVEALKMSAAQNQSHSASSKPAASPSPSGNPPHKTKPTSKPPPKQEEEEEGGSSAQDKIVRTWSSIDKLLMS